MYNKEWFRKNRRRLSDKEKLRQQKLREEIKRVRGSKCYLCDYKPSKITRKKSPLEIHHTKRTDNHKLRKDDISNKDVYLLCIYCHHMINRLKHLINLNRIIIDELPEPLKSLCQ